MYSLLHSNVTEWHHLLAPKRHVNRISTEFAERVWFEIKNDCGLSEEIQQIFWGPALQPVINSAGVWWCDGSLHVLTTLWVIVCCREWLSVCRVFVWVWVGSQGWGDIACPLLCAAASSDDAPQFVCLQRHSQILPQASTSRESLDYNLTLLSVVFMFLWLFFSLLILSTYFSFVFTVAK